MKKFMLSVLLSSMVTASFAATCMDNLKPGVNYNVIKLTTDQKVFQEKKEEQYEAMKKRIKFMYESGTGSATVEKVMTSGDMSSMLSQAEYSQKMHEYDREQLKEYTNTVTEIDAKKALALLKLKMRKWEEKEKGI